MWMWCEREEKQVYRTTTMTIYYTRMTIRRHWMRKKMKSHNARAIYLISCFKNKKKKSKWKWKILKNDEIELITFFFFQSWVLIFMKFIFLCSRGSFSSRFIEGTSKIHFHFSRDFWGAHEIEIEIFFFFFWQICYWYKGAYILVFTK